LREKFIESCLKFKEINNICLLFIIFKGNARHKEIYREGSEAVIDQIDIFSATSSI